METTGGRMTVHTRTILSSMTAPKEYEMDWSDYREPRRLIEELEEEVCWQRVNKLITTMQEMDGS